MAFTDVDPVCNINTILSEMRYIYMIICNELERVTYNMHN